MLICLDHLPGPLAGFGLMRPLFYKDFSKIHELLEIAGIFGSYTFPIASIGIKSFAQFSLSLTQNLVLSLRLFTILILFHLDCLSISIYFYFIFTQVEESIPTPKREVDKPFVMPIEDTFSISGRGTVATGAIEKGSIKVGDDIEIVGLAQTVRTTCTGKYIL